MNLNVAAEKSNGKYALKIIHDYDAPNPRDDDNIGKMICFHNRYSLGDRHGFSKPKDFLHSLLFDKYSSYPDSEYGKPVYDYIKQGYADGVRMEYNRSSREWELHEKSYWSNEDNWYIVTSYPANLKGKEVPDWFLDEVLSTLETKDLINLTEQMDGMIISPLYLYDHSVLSISMQSFAGRAHHADWDSGQVGWVYATHEDIAKEYGNASPASIEKAQKCIAAEVETYDKYLRGECYGFQLFKDGEEVDSCWGFIGDFDEAKKDIREHLPKEAQKLADTIEYGDKVTAAKKPSLLAQLEETVNEIKAAPMRPVTRKAEHSLG